MHPVDELYHLRRDISKMTARADALRNDLLKGGAPRQSNAYEVKVTTTRRRCCGSICKALLASIRCILSGL